jgi:hypothetical protein
VNSERKNILMITRDVERYERIAAALWPSFLVINAPDGRAASLLDIEFDVIIVDLPEVEPSTFEFLGALPRGGPVTVVLLQKTGDTELDVEEAKAPPEPLLN